MRILKGLLIFLLLVLLVAFVVGFWYFSALKPQYDGELIFEELEQEVEVYFDEYGVPHIYAQNEVDAYRTLGYLHAQDRLFQMEMMRRLSKGELAEVLGPDLAKTDRFFRTIGVVPSAQKSAKAFEELPDDSPMKKATLAYYEGINKFLYSGNTPIEFLMLGIPKRPFTVEDGNAIFGYMAFSFAQAFRTDPLLNRIQQKYGAPYLNDLDVHWNEAAQKIPVTPVATGSNTISDNIDDTYFDIDALFESLPVAPWIGSNAWVIGPQKTKSGKVIFSNDTHMRFTQPSVWYEAHIECPGLSLYGNYLSGVPFALTGHNRHLAVGLTMLENDDIDFYKEKLNPDNPNQVWFVDYWEDLDVRKEIIKVKGGKDIEFEVKTSRHGPIVNDAIDGIATKNKNEEAEQPIALWWVFNEFICQNMDIGYTFGHAKSIEDFKDGASRLHAPGLNGMYGDADGNIVWWTMGKLAKRPAHVNSKLFLDGASGKDEILGYYDFEENPHSVNPPQGYVYSANNQPESFDSLLYPGYYIPEDRASRIVEILNSNKKWDLENAKELINDSYSDVKLKMGQEIISLVQNSSDAKQFSENEKQALQILKNWNGDSQLKDIAPTIFTKILTNIIVQTFKDEMGETDFEAFLQTHVIKRTYPILLYNDDSKWWDDVSTTDKIESREYIVQTAFRKAIKDLEKQLGNDLQQWHWSKVHTIEHKHPFGRQEGMGTMFNVGPFPVNGNLEVINNMMFFFNEEGEYKVHAGPAKRRIIDFSDIEHSISVLPTGQSGNILSPHYDDQAQLFLEGEFRLQKMNRAEIEKGRRLLFKVK